MMLLTIICEFEVVIGPTKYPSKLLTFNPV